MSKYGLEDRVQRRMLVESDLAAHETEVGREVSPDVFISASVAARIAALEAEDTANPIAQTQQVRPDLRLNIDVAAFQAVYDDLDRE